MPRTTTPDKKQQIMHVAERLFTTRRLHEITLEEVAQQAGVGKGTIYTYFNDKDDLFFQVALAGFDELCELVEQEVDESLPFEQQLVHTCRKMDAFFMRRRQWFRLIQAETGRMNWCRGEIRERWMAHRGKLVAAVARVFEAGQRQAKVRTDVPASTLAHYLLGMLRTRAQELLEQEDPSASLELLVELFTKGSTVCRKVQDT